jgi:glycosyltransferase involved in cell wall biosynthesis
MISIITITYNAERFLERTINSIAGQEGCIVGIDYEYIIVDGASEDRTLSIIRQHEKQLTRWVSEPDRGLYDAMNKGLHLATGDYVWFMNAGDEIHDPATLLRLIAAINTTHADVYYSDALFVSDDGTTRSGPPVGLRSEVTSHTLPENLRWQDMALGMKVSHQAFVAHRSIAPDYDINNLSADLDWEIRCLKAAQRVHRLPFMLCKYLVGGISVQQHRRSLTDRFRVLVTHFGLLPTLWNHVRIVTRAVGRW